MKTKNILATVWGLSALVAWLLFSTTYFTNANPDYVCSKTLSGQPCEITSCGEWQTNHTRVCTWTQKTSVYYYRTRTNCEPGRSQARWGWYTTGVSWRKTADMYGTSSCSITQVDTWTPIK